MFNQPSDKLFEIGYRIGLFPMWLAADVLHCRKWVRFAAFFVSVPWMMVMLPIIFPLNIAMLLLMMWEDA